MDEQNIDKQDAGMGGTKPVTSDRHQDGFGYIVAPLALMAMMMAAGCAGDARLAGRTLPESVTVRTVAHYGQTLDEEASPEQVAYALLRAVRDDFTARRSADRDAAMATLFDLSAVNVIASRNRTSLTAAEHLYHVVHFWTPTVSHYAHDFASDWESARDRMVFSRTPGRKDASAETGEVRMLVNDPSGDPLARVVMIVWLARDKGFWRVTHLGFDSSTRTLAGTETANG